MLQEQSEEGIASNILADRLRRLVEEGLLSRADAGRGRRSTYSLTEAAIELVPVMAELGRWGAHNRPTTPTLRASRAARRRWAGYVEDLMTELRAEHLGMHVPPRSGPTATERLASAYAAALAADADH